MFPAALEGGLPRYVKESRGPHRLHPHRPQPAPPEWNPKLHGESQELEHIQFEEEPTGLAWFTMLSTSAAVPCNDHGSSRSNRMHPAAC